MAREIDERVVQMKFDAKQFGRGIQETLKDMDSLKKGLDMTATTKGLQDLEKGSRSVKLDGISSSLENISSKFNAMGVVAFTIFQNMTTSALNAGKRIVSAFTLDPIKMGFQEYETQINAVQTILANTASKGTNLKQVSSALDELNTYADKTIYNFTEMTKNIGTFTAAGVDLDVSVQAIKGIANLAAVSGSNAQQASTAMYQLSQALASGTVKLMDWNSIVNAGMGGQVFQDALKETARIHGVSIDTMIKQEGSFRETLKNGWLTSEVLTETLDKFTGDMTEAELMAEGYTKAQSAEILKLGAMANDAATKVKTFTQLIDTLKEAAQSGWTQTWEIMIGDFEEAKESLTTVSNVLGGFIGASSEARNSMLQTWKDLGGRKDLIDVISNSFQALMSILKPTGEAFRDIFPRTTAEQLKAVTTSLVEFSEKLKMGDVTADNLHRTMAGLFAVLDIAGTLIASVVKGFMSLVGAVVPAGEGILGITASLGDFLVSISTALKSTDGFNKVVGGIVGVVKPVISVLSAVAKAIGSTFSELGSVDTRFAPLEKSVSVVSAVFKNLREELAKLSPIAEKVVDVIEYMAYKLKNVIDNTFDNMDIGNIFGAISTAFAGAGFLELKKFVSSAKGTFDGISGLLDGVRGSLEAWQMSLKAQALMKIAVAIGILAASLTLLATIDSNKLTGALAAMTVVIVQLFGALAVFDKMMKGGGARSLVRMTITATSMIALSVAILILTAAVKQLGELDFKELAVGLVGVLGLVSVLVGASVVLDKTGAKMIKGSIGLVIFAGAVNLLANAVTKIADLSIGGVIKGLVGVGLLLRGITTFLNTTNLDGMSIVKGAGILLLANAISVLATAAGKFAVMDIGALTKGLVGVGVVLAEVAVFINSTGDATKVISTAIGLTILAAAMNVFAEAVIKFGSIPLNDLAKGLAGMAGSLVIVKLALDAMPKNIIAVGTGLMIVATAIVILSNAMTVLGSMPIGDIGKSLLALGGALAILSIALNTMNGTLPASAAILVASAALAILAPVLRSLGSMSIVEIGLALIALAGAFAIIGGAAVLLAPLTPALLALSVGMVAISAAVALFGIGISAFATGITLLANSGENIIELITSMLALIPAFFKKIGEGLVELAGVIGKGAPAIINAVLAIVVGIISGIADNGPKIIDSVLKMLIDILRSIVDNVPKFIKAGFDILVAFLKGVSDNIGKVVEIAIDIVVNFLNAVAKKLPEVIQAGFNLIIAFIDGLTKSINTNTPRFVASMQNLFRAVIKASLDILIGSIVGFIKVGGDLIGGLINGWNSGMDKLAKTVADACVRGINTIQTKVADFTEAGRNLINGFIGGIRSKISETASTAADMANTALKSAKKALGIKSPSREFVTVGRYICEGLSNGIQQYSDKAVGASTKMAKTVLGVYDNMMTAIESDPTLQPTITPVIDMDEATKNINTLKKMVVDGNLASNIPSIATQSNPIEYMLNMFGSIDKALVAIERLMGSVGSDKVNIEYMEVRNETDIQKIASELYRLQRISSRERGVII